jgi:transcription elongation GreA/GreB family factor
MARGLIGKSKNDAVEINSPKGIKFYTVVSVKFQL